MKQERSTLPRQKSHSRYHHRASEYKKKLNTLLLTPCRSSLTVEAEDTNPLEQYTVRELAEELFRRIGN